MTTYEERKLLKWEKLRIIEKKIMNQIYLDIEQLKDDDDESPESIRMLKKFKLKHAKQDMKNISRLGFFTIWTICALITE
jgi:hypothetical protein